MLTVKLPPTQVGILSKPHLNVNVKLRRESGDYST